MAKKTEKIRVLVGMSGGVDSTMAAFLLKRQGFYVVGITMKIWDDSLKIKTLKDGCYGPKERQSIFDAKKAAKKIGIPHYVIDLKKEYKKSVLDYFKREYLCGRTPNPCIVCNFKIKFGHLLKLAQASGIKFDKFATGHYAVVEFAKKQNRYVLKKGIDDLKDQSYFLYRLNQSQLKKAIFPIGKYRKSEIKSMAKRLGYGEFAKKQESQNFIGCDNYGVLFKNKFKKGNIIDVKGNIFGKHDGIVFYTIGQRKGLNIGGLKKPLYVLKINAKRNEIMVGARKLLFSKKMIVNDLTRNIARKAGQKIRCQAKIRFGSPAADCTIFVKKRGGAEVSFAKPQFAITPGQSAVFYRENDLLGGGIIAK